VNRYWVNHVKPNKHSQNKNIETTWKEKNDWGIDLKLCCFILLLQERLPCIRV